MKERLQKFVEEMENILDEKSEKYQDGWKFAKINKLLESLKKQLKTIEPSAYENSNINRRINKRNRRILLHIANYCFLVSERLGYGEW